MDTQSIVEALDREIDRLKQARAILATMPHLNATKRGPGHPRGDSSSTVPKKRVFSEEAKARMAAAQKKRWAAKNQGQ